jgi:hypothetical protein
LAPFFHLSTLPFKWRIFASALAESCVIDIFSALLCRNWSLVATVHKGSMLWSQFSTVFVNFRRKNWRFSKKQCYDHIFAKNSSSLSKKANIFAKIF